MESKTGELYQALSKAQGEFGKITRDKEVQVTMKAGGTYKYTYATANEIREKTQPALTKYGLSVCQILVEHEGWALLKTILGHTSGAQIESEIKINTGISDPKALGALFTYYRRYTKSAILDISSDDDDETALDTYKAAQAMKRPEPQRTFNEKAPVTQKQMQWLSDLMKKHKWTNEQVKQATLKLFKIDTPKNLNMGQFQVLIGRVQEFSYEDFINAQALLDFENEPDPEF